MNYIDWSDSEDIFGLLVNYIYDAKSDAEDSRHRGFLSGLIRDLEALQEKFDALPLTATVASLHDIHDSIDAEFADDSVVEHLSACADELERISAQSAV